MQQIYAGLDTELPFFVQDVLSGTYPGDAPRYPDEPTEAHHRHMANNIKRLSPEKRERLQTWANAKIKELAEADQVIANEFVPAVLLVQHEIHRNENAT